MLREIFIAINAYTKKYERSQNNLTLQLETLKKKNKLNPKLAEINKKDYQRDKQNKE